MTDSLQAARPHTLFHLADWTIDATTDRIRQGDTEHKLESKMMAVLVYMAGRAGEVITREELERDIWHGRVVGYDALTGCITKLRKILGDDSRNPRYIETIAKKGYRLVAEVTLSPAKLSPALPVAAGAEISPSPKAGRPRRTLSRWSLVVVAVVAIVAVLGISFKNKLVQPALGESDKPSIAVLPFGNLSNDTTQDYFSDGITADITTALSNHSGLFVISHPSAASYKGQDVDVNLAAGALGVRYILQGSVRRTDTKLRVNAQLIDARSGVHLWAERYDRTMQDVLDVQAEIAARIVGALEIKLTEEEKRRTARRYTISVDAYDAFLRGQDHYVRHTQEDNLQAQAAYQHALELDPNFARAYSALALTHAADQRFWHADPVAARELALTLAEKAVALDDTSPQTHWVLGYIHLYRGEFPQAVAAAQHAIRLNPNFADSYVVLANSVIYQGDAAAALPLMRTAMRLNPNYATPYALTLGQAYYFLGRYDDAVPTLRDAIERNASMLSPYIYLTATLSEQGKPDDAAWTAAQLRMLAPEFQADDVKDMFPMERAALAVMIDRLRRAGL